MALVKRQNNSTRIVTILVVVLVVAGVGFLLARQYFSGIGANPNGVGAGAGEKVITNFGETILNDSRYIDLQTFSGGAGPSTANVNIDLTAGQPQPFR